MTPARIAGFVVAVIGLVLLIFGLSATDSLTEEASDMVTGKYTEQTRWYIILGAAGIVGGILLAVFGSRRG